MTNNLCFVPYNVFYEVSFMDLLIERSGYKEKQLVAVLSMFVLTLLLSFVPMYKTSMCFALPMLLVAFCCGYSYSIAYFLAIIGSCVIFPENQVVVIASLTSFVVLQLASYLRFIKIRYVGFLVALIGIGYLYVFEYPTLTIALVGVITLLHSYLYLELVPIFVHRTIDVYTNKRLLVLSIVVMLCIVSLLDLNQAYMMVILRYYIVLTIYYLSIQIAMPCILYISVILIMQNYGLKDDILSIVLPCSIYFMYTPSNKIKCVTAYILSHMILPFFITYDYYYHGFVIILSALLFMVTPKLNIKNEVLTNDFKEQTNRNKLVQKANTFASLFRQLTTIFKESGSKVNTGEYVGYVYEDVCSKCSSREYCYYSKNGINRLVKLINKGINGTYSQEDLEYIKEYCVNPKEYIKNIAKYKDTYQRMEKVNQENQNLKNDLFYEFSLLSDIFDNFSNTVSYINIDEEHIKEYLLGYQFNITYLKKYRISNQSYSLEIGLMNTTKREITDELVPILETYLNETLDIVSLKDSMHHLGYTSVILKHDVNFILQHGFQQFSLDPIACGDSYTAFHQNTEHYLALSDGMGQGKEAAKESKLTLDVLSKLVLNGIELKDTLDSINALLRIKNRSDMFTTLDLCNINLANAKARFIKYGAYNSYHIRNQEIEEISCNSLPVGIVSNISMTSYEMTLQDQDIIIMASDGVGNDFYEIVSKTLPIIEDKHPQEIATILMDEVLEHSTLDDISIMAIRIIKQ